MPTNRQVALIGALVDGPRLDLSALDLEAQLEMSLAVVKMRKRIVAQEAEAERDDS